MPVKVTSVDLSSTIPCLPTSRNKGACFWLRPSGAALRLERQAGCGHCGRPTTFPLYTVVRTVFWHTAALLIEAATRRLKRRPLVGVHMSLKLTVLHEKATGDEVRVNPKLIRYF